MDYSVDQAKSIFDLIKMVSPYAYPLLIALVFPILWVLMKKVMGLSNNSVAFVNQGNIFQGFLSGVGNILSLSGDTADKVVFYICIFAFLIGGIVLKVGEHNEEIIRQKALGLKHVYEESGYLYYDLSALERQGYSENDINDITYKYPDEFVKSGSNIVCVDSSVKKSVFLINHLLLDSYLRDRLKKQNYVYMDELFQDDLVWNEKTGRKDKDVRNVKNFFSSDVVYTYLVLPANKEKYDLGVIKDRTVIIKPENKHPTGKGR